jgi:hypothetical protein
MMGLMADEKKTDERCVPCEWGFNILMALGVVAVAFLAWDAMSDGAATRWLEGLIGKVGPQLTLIRGGGGDEDEGAADAG